MQCVGAARQKGCKARMCSLHRRKCYISYEWNLIKAPPSSWHLNGGLWFWRGLGQLLIISAQQLWGKENICLGKGWRQKGNSYWKRNELWKYTRQMISNVIRSALPSTNPPHFIRGYDNSRGFLQVSFDMGICVIELWDFKVCSEARNG